MKNKYPPKLLEFIKDKPFAIAMLILMDYKSKKYTLNQIFKEYINYEQII